MSGGLPSPPYLAHSRSVYGMQRHSDKLRAHQSSPCGASPPHSLTHRTQRPCAASHGHQVAGAQGLVQHSRTAACPWRGTHFQCCRVLLPPQPVGSSEVWGQAPQSPRELNPGCTWRNCVLVPLRKGTPTSTFYTFYPLQIGHTQCSVC